MHPQEHRGARPHRLQHRVTLCPQRRLQRRQQPIRAIQCLGPNRRSARLFRRYHPRRMTLAGEQPRRINAPVAVSYTHLDVYKRQVYALVPDADRGPGLVRLAGCDPSRTG